MVEETEPLRPLNIFRNIPMYDGRQPDQHTPNLADLTIKDCSQSDIDVKPLIPPYHHYPDMTMDAMRHHLDVKPFAEQQHSGDIKPILADCPYAMRHNLDVKPFAVHQHSGDIKPILADCPYAYPMNTYSGVKCEKYSPPVSRIMTSQAALPVATSTIRYCSSVIPDEHPTVLKIAPNSNIHTNGSPAEVLCSTTTSPSAISTTTSPTPPYPHGNKGELKVKETKKGTRRPEKPQISYINLIAKVILESPGRKLTLSEIYAALRKE